MKYQRILVLLALISVSVFATLQDDGGVECITIKGTPDPDSCLLHLCVKLFPDHLEFTETVTNNDPPTCAFQNLTFWSVYRNDFSVSGQVTLANTGVQAIFQGNLTLALINQFNGSACVTIDGSYYYCYFKYGQIYFTVGFWMNQDTGSIDTNWTNIFFPVHGLTEWATIYSQQVLVPGPLNFTGLGGMFYDQCGGWGVNFTNLNIPITITGKIYAWNIQPLYPTFANFMVVAVILRPTNATGTETYRVIDTFGWYPFANEATDTTNLCYVTDKIWKDLITDNFCALGCFITFDMADFTPGAEKYWPMQMNTIYASVASS